VRKAFLTECWRLITKYFVIKNKTAPIHPAIPGAIAHAAKTCDTPSHPQLTFLIPTDATPDPTMPPIIECVVLTGKPSRVTMVRKVDDAMMAHIIASSRTGGSLLYR
jgi:hypothetical protein